MGKIARKLLSPQAREDLRETVWRMKDVALRVRAKVQPYEYSPERYSGTFLEREPPQDVSPSTLKAPPVLWSFWFGPEPSPARAAAIEALRGQQGLDFRLVTDPRQVEIDGEPFHPAFWDLHSVHRADYLRWYVMHHHGGVYADIKPYKMQIRPALDRLNEDASRWVAAHHEGTSLWSAFFVEEPIGRDVHDYFMMIMGGCAFAMRPRSVFTAEWGRELHRRLDSLLGQLRLAEGAESNPYSPPLAYPVGWSYVLNEILHPLSLKHQSRIIFADELLPARRNYR